METATQSPNPRNKDGKTNASIPYRYEKSVRSKNLQKDNVDISLLNKNEMILVEILLRDKYACISDLQDEIFSKKSCKLYGTSDTRNLLRRIGPTGIQLIEPIEDERGYYQLTTMGAAKLRAFKRALKRSAAKNTSKKKTK